MKTTSPTSNSLQERKQIRQELQKWGKNVLYLVGFEEVAQELLGSKRWKKITTGLSYRPSSPTSSPSLLPLIKDEKELLSSSSQIMTTDPFRISSEAVVFSPSSSVDDFKIREEDEDNQGGHQEVPLDLSFSKSRHSIDLTSSSSSSKIPISSVHSSRYTPQFPLSPKEVIASVSSEFKSSSSTSSSPLMVINPTSTPVLPASASPLKTTNRETTWKRSYTEESLRVALNDIISGKLGTRRAAVIYGIPRSTLRNKVYKIEQDSPFGAQRLCRRKARQLAAAAASTSPSTTLPSMDVQSSLKSLSTVGANIGDTKGALMLQPSKEAPSSSSMDNNLSSNSLLQVKKEPRIICKNKVKRKGTPSQRKSPSTLLPHRPSSPSVERGHKNPSLLDPPANLRASELLKQMLRENIVNKQACPVSSTIATTPSGTSSNTSNSMFTSKGAQFSSSLAASLPSSQLGASTSFTSNGSSFDQHRRLSHEEEEEEDVFSGSNLYDPNSRLKAALNNGVASNLTNNMTNNNLYQSQFNQMFGQQMQTGVAVNESPVNPLEMLSSLDPASLQALAPLIYAYLFNIERLFLASSVAAAAANSSNPSSPPTNLVPQLIPQTVIPFQTSFPIRDNDTLKPVASAPQPMSLKKRVREEKKTELDMEMTASSTTKSGSKNRPKRGQYRKYSREALDKAVQAVQSGEMSVHRAGSYYKVPHSTLEYKVKNRKDLRDKKPRLNSSSQSREESDASPTNNACQTVIGETIVDCATEARSMESMPVSEEGSMDLD